MSDEEFKKLAESLDELKKFRNATRETQKGLELPWGETLRLKSNNLFLLGADARIVISPVLIECGGLPSIVSRNEIPMDAKVHWRWE